MASTEEENGTQNAEASSSTTAVEAAGAGVAAQGDQVEFDGGAPAQLGTTKYVQAAFFACGVIGAYLLGQILASIWNFLASWPVAVRNVPVLLSYAEDERPPLTMVVGGIIALIYVVYKMRQPAVRQWADEVAAELYKVHWPGRDTVTQGTIVVIVASVFATLYIGLLDRVWGFITNLVYGA